MINKSFEAYKVKREIRRSGRAYVFKRDAKNEFGEPSGGSEIVSTVNGLYHEQNSYVQLTIGEAAQTRKKNVPMILCIFDDSTKIEFGDYTEINGKRYNVTGVTNIQEWNIIADISLEVVDKIGS